MSPVNKRAAKTSRELSNKSKMKRELYDKVLIVLEDEKSAANYFYVLQDQLKISQANIKIVPANQKGEEKHRNDPIAVVKYAIQEYQKEKDYDAVFCVIDRDQHTGYVAALQKARDTKKIKNLYMVVSIPCFEYWLLLHFQKTNAFFDGCDAVMQKLKKYIPDYNKKLDFKNWDILYKNYFISKQSQSIENAKYVIEQHQKDINNNWNPSTQLHILIEYLIAIKNQPPKKIICEFIESGKEIVSILTLKDKL